MGLYEVIMIGLFAGIILSLLIILFLPIIEMMAYVVGFIAWIVKTALEKDEKPS